MNILPKKRWHVRTKDNIARVRRDQAKAAEEEGIRVQKQEFAENEARLNFLRSKAGSTLVGPSQETASSGTITASDGHVDLFSDFQSHIKTINKEHEKEKKEEQEKYEKQIGYLTYLGQDTNEALKLRSWYEVPPDRAEVGERVIVEKDLKSKHLNDPLTLIKSLLPEEKILSKPKIVSAPVLQLKGHNEKIPEKVRSKVKKSKKEKKHKKDKKNKKHREKHIRNEEKQLEELARKKELINKLRQERLKRETRERARQEELLCPKVEKAKEEEKRTGPRIVQKYNSQFNPELAKQNMV